MSHTYYLLRRRSVALSLAFADFQDAKRVLDVLGKRLARYELTLHPDKTRFVDFRSNRPDWCRTHRHLSIPEQHAQLGAKMRGHYAYYGMSGNIRRLSWYAYQVRRIWQKWLSRRGSRFPWDRYIDLLQRYPLPAPRIVHRYTAVSDRLASVADQRHA